MASSSTFGWNPAAGAKASGASASGSSWGYNPNSTYGAANGTGYATAPIINGPNGYLENDPRAIWTRYLGDVGINSSAKNNEFYQFAQNQYTNFDRDYKAALATNPSLLRQDFARGLGTYQDWMSRFNAQSPAARGENWNQFAPRARYIGR